MAHLFHLDLILMLLKPRETQAVVPRLLALLMHVALWWHRVGALRLLLLEVGLVLQGLLLICSHVALRRLVARHALSRHGLWHWRRGGMLFFWRLHSRLGVDAVGVCRLGRVQTGLGCGQY